MPSWLEAVKSNDPWSAVDLGQGKWHGTREIWHCFRVFSILYTLYIYIHYIYIVSWCPCYRPIHIFVLLICSNHRLLIIHCSSFRQERAQQSSQIRPNKNTSSKKRSQSQLPGAANQLSSRTCVTIIKKGHQKPGNKALSVINHMVLPYQSYHDGFLGPL